MANKRASLEREQEQYQSLYSREFINALKQHVDMNKVIESKLRTSGWRVKGKRVVLYPCPFCSRAGVTLRVWKNTQTYLCVACKNKGDVLQFLMDFYGIHFRSAIECLVEETSFNAVWNHHKEKKVKNKSAV